MNNGRDDSLDWVARDRNLTERLRLAAEEITKSVPLKRASREKILRYARISRTTLERKDKLPLSSATLAKLEESVADFLDRRLRRAALIAPERNLPVKPWALLKLTRVRKKDVTPRVANLIDELVSSPERSQPTSN